MKILYLDAFSGISGDMFLGLLVDLGVPLSYIEQELAKLPLDGYRLSQNRETRNGIEGCRVQVACDEQHHHRTWADIDALLERSDLTSVAKDRARAIFRLIGVAEARVHGVPLETVHFHEVGALDSIVDIVGAAVGLEHLGDLDIVCSPLPLARGMADTAHGRFPLPAPATVALLNGCPVVDGACERELVTPTGAAIVAEVARFDAIPAMTIAQVGYGVGCRTLADRPNVLRGILGETEGKTALQHDRVTVLETHLDDANPEWLGALLDRLMEEGALDAAYAPLQMKKNRPGARLTVVSPSQSAEALSRLILRESSAIGVRRYETARSKLRREAATVQTALGEAAVKLIFEGAQLLRVTPEHDSCLLLARRHKKPLPEIYRLIEQAANALFNERESN